MPGGRIENPGEKICTNSRFPLSTTPRARTATFWTHPKLLVTYIYSQPRVGPCYPGNAANLRARISSMTAPRSEPRGTGYSLPSGGGVAKGPPFDVRGVHTAEPSNTRKKP